MADPGEVADPSGVEPGCCGIGIGSKANDWMRTRGLRRTFDVKHKT